MKTKQDYINDIMIVLEMFLSGYGLMRYMPRGLLNNIKSGLSKLSKSVLSELKFVLELIQIGVDERNENPSPEEITRALETLKNAVYHAEDQLHDKYPEDTNPMPDRMLDKVEKRQVSAQVWVKDLTRYLN